jgi:hypothetical protein
VVTRTAESVVLTDWPPARRALDVDAQVALLVDMDLDLVDLGQDDTVTVEVWIRPTIGRGMRWTRWTPPSNEAGCTRRRRGPG